MTTAELLEKLRALDIEVRVEGDKLLVNAPKGAITPELSDEVRGRKPEIIAFLQLAGNTRGASSIAPAGLTPDADGTLRAPASFGQQRLFYLSELDPGLAVYNVAVAYHLEGPCDGVALRRALAKITQRHAVLRSRLALETGEIVQLIAAEAELPLVELNLEKLEPNAREAEVRAALTNAACAPFDLTTGPLGRVLHIAVGDQSSIVCVTAHHVITDGLSQEVFERELVAILADDAAVLPDLPIGYPDYAVWQTTHDAAPATVDYWRQMFSGALPVLALPTTRPRAGVASTGGATRARVLPRSLLDSLSAIGRKSEATLFMVLLSAYGALLSRITGQADIIVGTPVANREHKEVLDLLGFFANTLALRLSIQAGATFTEVLAKTREVSLGALAHQEMPFERLLEVVQVDRDVSRTPVFQTMFAFEDAESPPGPEVSAGPIRVRRRETIHSKVSRTDLSAWVSAHPDGLLVTVEFPTALLDDCDVDRLLDQYEMLLTAVSAEPGLLVSKIPLLSPAERARLVHEFNETAAPLSSAVFASELFQAQAARTPDRIAVRDDRGALTYGELDARANQWAHHLMSLAVPRGALVGVFVPRGLDMLVAIHAIWRVGAAYVPIDPEYPAERIAHMVTDSAVRLVVTTSELASRLPEGAARLLLDRDAGALASGPTSPRAALTGDGSDPAYVIYTSGSTGKPKGVVVPHRAFINFVGSMSKVPGFAAEDVLVAVTTLSFDIAGLELHAPLAVGGCVVIASAETAADGTELSQLLLRSKATCMQATPSTWRLLLTADFKPERSFKILCGGEAFPSDLADRLLALSDQVFNLYGPTETTVWSTVEKLAPGQPVTIGRPIDNTSVYILDAHGEPQPINVPGELVIGGRGVALGYLNRTELTSERFVPDPFCGATGAMMYRTGDLASFLADGRIVYHQRLDHQVKVRGYRIELGEVEAVLATHQLIAACIVTVREDRPGDARLCAYFVPRAASPTATELRKHLRKHLPDYMIPQHFTELRRLPLTPAGKLDRKALPAPQGAVPSREARKPSTASELLLADVWKQALRLETLSASDNFFDIGGHSLLSMSVIAEVQKRTGVRLTPREMVRAPLEVLASRLDSVGADASAGQRPGADSPKAPPASTPAPVSAATESVPAPKAPAAPTESKAADGFLSRIKGKLFGR